MPMSKVVRNLASSAIKMPSIADGRYDIVVYGATGYTGQYVVEEVARVARMEESKTNQPLTWAVAGRNKDKLMSTLKKAKKELGMDLDDVGLIVADVADQGSLNDMAAKSNIVVNCVGPYHLYGEPVIKACIDNGASHVDISGEPIFLEGMQLKYDEAAEVAGVHIVGACGYDSIPAEMGVNTLINNFPGELNSVETYLTTHSKRGRTSIHTGTMESAILAIANRSEYAGIRSKLYPTRLPKPSHRVPNKGFIHKNPNLGIWGIPLPTDEPMVYRTQRYRHDVLGLRPIQYKGYLGLPNMFASVGVLIGIAYFALLASFNWTRKLLLKYPEMLTAGVFTRAGPDHEALKGLTFTSTLVGHGWMEKISDGSQQHLTPPDACLTVKVSGPDPGYGATSLMMVASALTILREKELCTRKGGVMTPGIAFMNTSLVERLVDRGMAFKVEQSLNNASKSKL